MAPGAVPEHMQGGAGLYVMLDGVLKDAHAVLAGIDGVQVLQVIDGGHVVQLDDEALRRVISERAAAADMPVLEMRPQSVTLEDIFLNIIGEQV